MFLTQYFSRRRQKSKSQLSIYIVRLEFQRIETGISARRDCSFSIVKLESHSTEIIWYWVRTIYFSFSVISNVCEISQSTYFEIPHYVSG